MRPGLIPDAEVIFPWRRTVLMPPGDSMDSIVSPIEVLVAMAENLQSSATSDPVKLYKVRCILEDDDLAKLADGEPIWLTFFEHVVPFQVKVGE